MEREGGDGEGGDGDGGDGEEGDDLISKGPQEEDWGAGFGKAFELDFSQISTF
jgi:hypothetical protein